MRDSATNSQGFSPSQGVMSQNDRQGSAPCSTACIDSMLTSLASSLLSGQLRKYHRYQEQNPHPPQE